MELKQVDIESLKASRYNPRKELKQGDKEFQQLCNSIKEFGYSSPIIVNKDLTVIGGHQRLNALKYLGYKKIEVIVVDLNKTQEKAFNIALNKISGDWNEELLTNLLGELYQDGFDIDLTGFEEFEMNFKGLTEEKESPEDFEDEEEKENQRMNTVYQYNLHLYYSRLAHGFYDMPIIYDDGVIPENLIGFNYAKTSERKDVGIHCFVDDYQFERLWNSPERYIDTLAEYQCVLSPDFSLYMNMPMAMKVWNVYRSRLLGQYWQQEGIKVIPTISWAEAETFEFAFDGIPEGSTVAVSTIGVKKNAEAFEIWKNGMDEMIKRIKPKTILVYGGKLDYEYKKGITVKYFENLVTERMQSWKE